MWSYVLEPALVALHVLDEFAAHEIAYRSMVQADVDLSPPVPRFWTDTRNAHAMAAVNLWNMVFGTSGENNPTHWHNWITGDLDEARQNFIVHLEDEANMTAPEWHELGQRMRDFRNNYTAHREIENAHAMPYLNRALAAAQSFDTWMHGWIPEMVERSLLRDEVAGLRPTIDQSVAETLAWVDEQARREQ